MSRSRMALMVIAAIAKPDGPSQLASLKRIMIMA
jgi:hypothetical protein